MRRAILALGLFVTLGGCPQPNPVVNNTVEPLPTPTPTPWLTADPICSGQITRAEWLICDNKGLNDLHRRLAWQWQTDRQNATPERMDVLENQLYALLSERDACQDVACVATAYRRYIVGAVPVTPTRPVVVKPKPKPKPKPRPHHGGRGPRGGYGGDGDWRPGAGEQSCAAQIGPQAAARLSQQCDLVTQGNDHLCSPRRSCDALRDQTDHGCRETYRKPGFCRL